MHELLSEWKNHPVSEWILKEFQNRAELMIEELRFSAGRDPVEDARKSGYLMAVADLIGIEVSE